MAAVLGGPAARVRQRGGIYDDLLDEYVEHGGGGFYLSKARKPLLSPFGPFTTRPLFLTNTDQGRFDNVQPRERGNWYTDWLRRSLGLGLPLHEARDVYGEVLPLLVKSGVLMTRESGKRRVWGLQPGALAVSRRHTWRVCTECGFEQPAVEGSVSDPLNQPCPKYRCPGTLTRRTAMRSSRAQSYYRRFYERKALGRVWSREHTGLLKRDERESLEIEFKQRPRPDAANMLSCTPTLEMGIDIGDLSATMLCSVPPSAASYVQRVGRAGRFTGNALILTFASTQQHDLHFYGDPEAAMAGAIRPPGCYLDAPEVLKRQALAFCFDHWARQGHKMPGRVRELVAAGNDAGAFPRSFFAFVDARREALNSGFFELFDRRVLRVESREKLTRFFAGAGPGTSELEGRIAFELNEVRRRRDELRRMHQRVRERIKALETDPLAAKKVEQPEEELRELRGERGYLAAELDALLDQDVWGWLCEASLLPNYAFPEAGVRLHAFIRREQVGPDSPEQPSEEHSWTRAPASAISELAPFNTFYGSGRNVRIDNIDLERIGSTGEWQLCEKCHHMQPVAELGEHVPEQCPACGATGWGERGRRRTLVRMSQVRAFTRQRDAVVSDETEDRERAYYETRNFYDTRGETPRNVWVNASAGFGFELLPSLKLRRVNFGKLDARADTSELGGMPVANVAFVVCEACGQVHDPSATQSPRGRARPKHRGACPNRDKQKAPFRQLHLYRELESEAIRLMVPVAAMDAEARLANLRAALRLGLREFYGGDPEFLNVDTYDEPSDEGDHARRRYLLVQDVVPGGTGLLAELTEDKGAKLKQLLEAAHDAIRRCTCQARTPPVKACYRCLYAYREQRVLHLLDRRIATELLEQMLAAFDDLSQIRTVGELSIESILESELEQRFRQLLSSLGERDGFEVEPLEHEQLRITVAGRAWRYQPQVPLREDEVLHGCRPDFVLYPEGQEPEVRAVAGFADGAAYHVKPDAPRGVIQDDFRKRAGIVSSGRYVTWSFGWHDIDAFRAADDLGPWLEGNVLQGIEKLVNHLGIKVGNLAAADPVRALLGYLVEPRAWPKLAGCVAAVAMHASGRQAPAALIDGELSRLASAEEPTVGLRESVPGDSLWARLSFGTYQEAVALLSATKEGARRLHTDPAAARGVLRLSDSAVHRSRKEYVGSWRLFLRAYNLLQFLPNVRVVTDEQILGGLPEGPLAPMASPLPSSVPAPSEAPGAGQGLEFSERLVELLAEIERGAPAAVPAVRSALGRGFVGLQCPVEVLEPGHAGDIEFGWPEQRVGAFLDEQRHTAQLLESRGWRLFPIEAGLSGEVLIAALEASR